MSRRAAFILVPALFAAVLAGRPSAGQEATQTGSEAAASVPVFGLTALPVLFYTPETRWAGGAAALLTVWPSSRREGARPSTLTVYSVYTELKQFQLELQPALYMDDERWLIQGNLVFEKYPNLYWGVGNGTPDSNETGYTPRRFSLEAYIQRKVLEDQGLYAGLQLQFERLTMVEAPEDGPPPISEEPGSAGGTIAGLGVALNWDTRDHVFIPSRGDYFQVSLVAGSKALGGDFGYTSVKADLRKFVPGLGDGHVLGFQFLYQGIIAGTPPFYRLAKLGGNGIMRGYYNGRYRDRHLMALQAEYRLPVWWKFGLVGFAGLGRVAPTLAGLDPAGFKYSAGLGVRFKVASRAGANLRFDWAFGQGTSGIYLTAGEAF